jgi:hypothetical protein
VSTIELIIFDNDVSSLFGVELLVKDVYPLVEDGIAVVEVADEVDFDVIVVVDVDAVEVEVDVDDVVVEVDVDDVVVEVDVDDVVVEVDVDDVVVEVVVIAVKHLIIFKLVK